jgi:hypothetical protein
MPRQSNNNDNNNNNNNNSNNNWRSLQIMEILSMKFSPPFVTPSLLLFQLKKLKKKSTVHYTTRQHPNPPHYNSECGESMFLRNVRIQRLHGSTTHKTAIQTSSILVYNMQLRSERSQSFINYQQVRGSHFVNFHLPKRCIIFKDLTIRK